MKNVILLTIDALRSDMLGCYGGWGNLTPFIDSIQDKCIRFSRNQSTGPYTQASFPGILTSSYYLEHVKEEKAHHKLSKKRTLISEVLQPMGIITAAFHSNAYLWDYFGWNRGWDKFYDSSEDEVPDWMPYIKAFDLNKKIRLWMESQRARIAEKPLFLWVHYMDVHEPYVPEQKYIDNVDSDLRLSRDHMMDLFKNIILNRDASDKEKVDTLRNLYMAHVSEMDDATRDFFKMLDDVGILKDSVLILASDHGDEFGDHGGLSHDGKMYEELIHTPLIIYDHSLEEGIVSDTVVSNVDIPPTIVHLLGLEPVNAFQGHALLPLERYPERGVFGDAIDKHSSTEKGATEAVFFYRDGDLKLIYNQKNDSWELYDLKEDPKETVNIYQRSTASETMMKILMPRISKWKRS